MGVNVKNTWTRLLLGIVVLSVFMAVVAQGYLAWTAAQTGKSPIDAIRMSQQRLWAVILNPWVFWSYLSALVLLLWQVARGPLKRGWTSNDFWLSGAIAAAIVTLIVRFVQSQLH